MQHVSVVSKDFFRTRIQTHVFATDDLAKYVVSLVEVQRGDGACGTQPRIHRHINTRAVTDTAVVDVVIPGTVTAAATVAVAATVTATVVVFVVVADVVGVVFDWNAVVWRGDVGAQRGHLRKQIVLRQIRFAFADNNTVAVVVAVAVAVAVTTVVADDELSHECIEWKQRLTPLIVHVVRTSLKRTGTKE
jgi:hypothetical protein